MKEFKKVIFLLLIIILLTAIFWTCSLFTPKGLESFLPSKVDELVLRRIVAGEEAVATAVRSHQGKVKNADNMIIGYYDGGLSIWITEYSDSSTCGEETIKMIDAMKKFEEGFEKIESNKIKDVQVYTTEPGGGRQYFWAQNRFMVYVVPGELSEGKSRELISELTDSLR